MARCCTSRPSPSSTWRSVDTRKYATSFMLVLPWSRCSVRALTCDVNPVLRDVTADALLTLPSSACELRQFTDAHSDCDADRQFCVESVGVGGTNLRGLFDDRTQTSTFVP